MILADLIRLLRANRGASFDVAISKAIKESLEEIENGAIEGKAQAILKLSYLFMLGYPVHHTLELI
jgi:rRNA-processing protein FCF1